MSPIKTLVLGYGLSAKVFHLPFLLENPQFEVVAVLTSQPLLAEHAARGVRAVTEFDAAFSTDIQLVVVTTPNQTHADFAMRALRRGCHVVVEKPLCVDSATAYQLADLANQQQRLLVPFFNRRFDDDFLSLRHWLSTQAEPVLLFESRYDRFRPQAQSRWKENADVGSGVLFDLAPHLIDQMLQLFGMPQAVTASIRTLRPSSVCIDYFQLQCHYPQFEAVLSSSPVQPRIASRFDVQTLAASWSSQGFDPQEDQLRFGRYSEKPRQAVVTTAKESHPLPMLQGDYGQFYQQLAYALVQGGEPPSTVQQAIDGLRVLEAAWQSQVQGKRVDL